MNRSQRIKFASDCFSEWGPVPTSVPQAAKLGLWLFLLMINNLDTNAQHWKYVDDTTVSEVVVKGREIHVQAIADSVIEWSHENRVQLNADKCKELRISFAKEQRVFDPVIIEGKEVELVTSTKLLGLTIANNLTPVFFNGLPQYLKRELVQLEKIAISIITSGKCNSAIEVGLTPIITYYVAGFLITLSVIQTIN